MVLVPHTGAYSIVHATAPPPTTTVAVAVAVFPEAFRTVMVTL
jgi:hypothetical protein